MFRYSTSSDQPTHNTQPTTRWRTPSREHRRRRRTTSTSSCRPSDQSTSSPGSPCQFVLRGVNDELWTHTARQDHDVAAAVAEEEQAAHVAAVRGQSGRANRETAAAVEEDVSGGPEGGKLSVQQCINAVTPGSLFHIQGQHTHRRFLCDTGAA